MDVSLSVTGLKAMVRCSSKKLLLNRRWIIVALVAVLVAAVMGYSATQNVDRLSEGSDLINLLILSFLLPVMAMVYGGSMIRNEIDDRSITPVITSPVDRRVSYLGYYLSLILVLAVIMLLILIIGWSSFFLMSSVDSSAASMLLAYAIVLLIGAVVYSSLFLVLGVVFKQPIYLGLLYAFVWEGFVGSVPGAIGDYTIRHQLSVIASDLIDSGSIANVSGDLTSSAIVLVALTIFLLVAGAIAFREKEVP